MIARRWGMLAMAGSLMAGAGPAAAGKTDFTFSLPVTPAPGGGVQRLSLPAGAIAASRQADGGDVRIVDAHGRSVPIARLAPQAGSARTVVLKPLPILGSADAVRVTGVTYRLDDDAGAKVARIQGVPAGTGSTMLGVLLDLAGGADRPARLKLDVRIPAQQPVSFTIDTSGDLEDWQPIARQTVYRPADQPAATATIPLDAGASRQWLRVRWTSATRLLSPITIQAARVDVPSEGSGGTAMSIDALLPDHADPRTVEFARPFPSPTIAVGLKAPEGIGLVSFRMLGRDMPEQPWALLGEGVASPKRAGLVTFGPGGRTLPAMIRIEADDRGGPLPPRTRLRFDLKPADLAFLVDGAVPLSLVAGSAEAPDVALPLASLMAGGDVADPARLPRATVRAGAPAPIQLSPADTDRRRQWILWLVLLAATLLLGLLVLKLARSRPTAERETGPLADN